MTKGITHVLKKHVEKHFDTKNGQIRKFPKSIIILSYIMCINIFVQGFFDIVIKVGGYTPWIVAMPWRIDFLFLTAVSVLMGFQTLNGMKQQKLDVTRNSIQIGLIVETALVVGDLHFLSVYGSIIPEVFMFRLPFVVLTMLNIATLGYIITKMHIFRDKKGKLALY